MDQRLEPIINWLNECRDHIVRIEKRETDDEDVTELKIQGVHFTEHTDNHDDDYIAAKEIILKGEGWIVNVKDHPPLPQNQFEIPLIEAWEGDCRESGMSLKTGRARYVVTRLD